MYTKLKLFRLVALAVTLLLFQNGIGQYSSEVDTYRNLYPNAHSVRLKQYVDVEISLKDGEIEIIQEFVEEDLYLDESATQKSSRSVSFSSFFEMQDLEASSFVFDSKKYREIEVEEFMEKDELDHSFHDDTKSVNFIYPDLRKGSKSLLKYSEKVKNPRFLSPFFFADYFPIIHNRFRIKVDEEIKLRFLKFNTGETQIKHKEEEKWGKRIYTWETGVVDEYYHEEGTPGYRSLLPHIIPVISSYTHNGKTKKVLNDVSDLYDWYYSLVKDLNKQEPDAGLVDLVEELTRGMDSELEKVRAIYYWTQQNIKYIDFEYALGGFIPREANLVYKKKYGDCKDNSSILQEMLSIAGIEGRLTWIGTRTIPYTYEEVPTPAVDNHMILSYVNNGNTYYLDATGRFIPLELPSSFIQGKEALVGFGPGEYRIERVPVIPARVNAVIEKNKIELKEGVLSGVTNTRITGYNRMELFSDLEGLSSQTKLKEFYNNFFRKGSNKFLISEFSEENKFDYSNEYKLSYNFDIDNYGNELGDEIYLNLNLNRELSKYRIKESRKTDIEMRYQHYFSYSTELRIPEGYALEFLPKSQELSNEYITSNIGYSHEGDKVIYTHEVAINYLNLDKQGQKKVNALIDKAEKAYKEVIILKKLKTS